MLIFKKLRIFAQMVGFATIGMLALCGGFVVLNNAQSVLAAEPAALGTEASATGADVPYLINYQGTLRDGEGNLLSGAYTMTMRIYDDVTALTSGAIYTATYPNVTVRDGHFSVLLGDLPNPPLPPTIFTNPDRFIGVTVAGFDEMVPRQRFASVPYTIQADRAFALDGRDAVPYTAVWVDQGKVQIGNQDSTHQAVTADDDAQVTVENQANYRWGMLISSTGGGSAKGLKIKTAYPGHSDIPLFLASAGAGADEYRRFVIEANGNVGIGDHVPQTKLDILGDGPQIRFGGTNGNFWQLWGGSMLHLTQGNPDGHVDRLVFDNVGNVSIPTGGLTANALSTTGGLGVAGNATVQGNLTVAGTIKGNLELINEVVVDSAEGPKKLLRADEGFCFLTYVRGDFLYASRTAHVYIESDGYFDFWWLDSGPEGIFAGATCVKTR